MSLNLGTMYAALALDPSNFNNTLNALPDEAQSVFSKIQGIIGRAFSFDQVIAFGKKSMNAFMEQENALNAYSAALKNLGIEYNARTREANAFASEMQKITKYGDEMTVGAMAQGIKLGIDPSQIRQATKAAMVMAEKYAIDLPSAMMLLGRASQGQTQMLTRYGIVLDETMSAEEKFNHLLQMGTDEFSLVTAAAQTTEGQLTQSMNAVGDTMETVGGVIASFITPLAGLAGSAAAAFNSLSPGIQNATIYAAALITTMKLLGSEMGQNFLKLANEGVKSIASSIQAYDYDAAAKEAAEKRKIAAVKASIAELEAIQAAHAVKTAMANEKNALNELNSLKNKGSAGIPVDNQELLAAEQKYAAAIKNTIAAKKSAAAAEVNAATARKASTAATNTATFAQAQNAKVTAASSGVFTKMGLAVQRGARSASMAMKGFFASLGPIGWAILAIEGLIAVYNLISGAAEEAAEKQRAAAEEAVKQSQDNLREKNRELEAYENKMQRLEELNEKEKLSSDEAREANKLLREMNDLYGVNAGCIDQVTGKLVLQTNELDKNLKKQREAKVTAAEEALKAARGARAVSYHRVLDQHADDDWGRAGGEGGDYDEARGFLGDVTYEGDAFDVGQINETLKRDDLSSELREELEKARDAQLQVQKLERELESAKQAFNNVDQERENKIKERKEKTKAEWDKRTADAKKSYSDAKEKADYEAMSNEDKLKYWQQKRNPHQETLRREYFMKNKYGDNYEFSADYYKAQEDLLKIDKEIAAIQERITDEKKRQADEAEREAEARERKQQDDQKFLDNASEQHSAIFSEAEKRKAQEETDRQFRKLLNLGRGSEAARFAGTRKYQVEEKIAQNQQEFERAKTEAMADGSLNDSEKAYINSLIEAGSKLQSELENWEGKIKEAETVDNEATKETSAAVSFSTEMLNAMLGANSPEKETAKHTKKMEEHTREMVRMQREQQAQNNKQQTYTN